MSIAVISLDTQTKSCVLTLDGALVQADTIYFSKGTDYNGDPLLVFKYGVQVTDNNGLNQTIEYELPQPDMSMEGCKIEKNGLASKIIDRAKILIDDVTNFINKRK